MPNTYLIQITEIGEGDTIKCEHYRRRAELGNVNEVIRVLDNAVCRDQAAARTS